MFFRKNRSDDENEDEDMETSDNEAGAGTSGAAANARNPDDEFNFAAYDDEGKSCQKTTTCF